MTKKLHTKYKVGTKVVPSVTTVIANLGWNKNALMAWAKRMAAGGDDPDAIKSEAASIGTLTHKMVEDHINGNPTNTFIYSGHDIEKASLGYNAFLDWESQHQPKYLETELQLSAPTYFYGGTIDLIVEMHGQKGIIDLKTSSGIYPEHIIQLAAYHHLYQDNFFEDKLEFWAILKLDKKTGDFNYMNISKEQINLAFEVFLSLLDIHKLKGTF